MAGETNLYKYDSGSGKYVAVEQGAAVADPTQTQDTLLDSSGGTPSTTLPAISASPSQAEVADSVASLNAQLNKINTDLALTNMKLAAINANLESLGLQAA